MARASKHRQKQGASQEIERLFALAETIALEDPKLAQISIEKARKLALRLRVSTRAHNRKYCRACHVFFTSENHRVRTTKTSVVSTCLSCGRIVRYRKT